jgi:hypothetical protein
MTIQSQRLALQKPTTADPFDTDEIADNWQIVDNHPGIFLCTSGTRPSTWGLNHRGMMIYEGDTDLYWRWDGTQFGRAFAVGWLNGSSRTADLSTTSLTPITAVSAAVSVPAGNRKVQVTVSWAQVENTVGLTVLWLYRDETVLTGWLATGATDATVPQDRGLGGAMPFFDRPGAGAFTYSFRFSVMPGVGGTSWVRASVFAPTLLDVIEV